MISDPYTLLPTAYRAAVEVLHSPIMAEEASERAIYQLTLAIMSGSPPDSPVAWLRVVARRSACALLRSEWARTKAMDLTDVATPQQRFPSTETNTSEVRETLHKTLKNGLHSALTPRQREALDAAISCNTMRAAARTCGMAPRDFRRSLGSISRRARALLQDSHTLDPALPGCEPGMSV